MGFFFTGETYPLKKGTHLFTGGNQIGIFGRSSETRKLTSRDTLWKVTEFDSLLGSSKDLGP